MIETHTINLGSALLRTTNVNEMTPKKKKQKKLTFEIFVIFRYI
jgi:hypothetical protein